MPRVAIAGISTLAAEAGARVADEGGNAVDAAVATAIASAVTAPGLCSLGGGGFAVIGTPGTVAEAIDGGFEMPGRSLPMDRFGAERMEVQLEYGGGVTTNVGPASVATPGALALCAKASERHGILPWANLVEPSFEHARDGFPLLQPSHEYLTYSHQLVFGWNEDSFAAVHDEEGRLLGRGETVHVPDLAGSLRRIADLGARDFYEGELGKTISDYITGEGGLLTPRDLSEYEAVVRPPILFSRGDWRLATNPTPAVGGVVLTAMLKLIERAETAPWSPEWVANLANVQEAVLRRRSDRLDASDALGREAEALLREAASGELRLPTSGSTIHASAVDDDGLSCSITLSDGYGSGTIAPGTGIWLNNCLGEPELNPHGYHGWPPGHRLLSNMAPTVARHEKGGGLAIGSPGADRITTALLQVLVNFLDLGMSLQSAIDHPRLHMELVDDGSRAVVEPGIQTETLEGPIRFFEDRSMYFGGVTAARWDPEAGFEFGTDDRRVGGVAVGGR